jgi:uncharacterized protein (TIRG00374 family)
MRAAKLTIRILLSLGLSALFVWLSLRHTDLRAVVRNIAAADPTRVGLSVLLLLCIHLIRTLRWGILLEPFGHVGFKRLNAASAVGFMLLILLPLRLGEFGRPFAIAQPPAGGGVRIRRSGAMASCVVERIVDGIFIGLLGIVALWVLGPMVTGPYAAFARSASVAVAAGFGALCVVLIFTLFQHDRTLRIARRLLTPLSPKLAVRAVGMMDAFLGSVHVGSGWSAAAFFLLTALYWSANAFGLWLLGPAFGIQLTPLMAATVLAVQVVGVMVPAGPGMVGTMSYFTAIGVSLFVPAALVDGSPAASQVAAYANTIWLVQFSVQVCLGLFFMAQSHITLKGLFSFSSSEAAEGEGPVDPARATAGNPA